MTDPSPLDLPQFSRGLEHPSGGMLLPVIAQDATSGRVLMFAWMNREAFDETQASGMAVYYSRSRGKLWRKGETSGHQQKVIEVRVDCDADAILLRIEQVGAACHEGYESCFFRRLTNTGEPQIDEDRLVNPDEVYGN